MAGNAGKHPTVPARRRKPQNARARIEQEAREGPELAPPDEDGVWVPLGKSMRKDQLPDGRSYLRSGLRDAWAWCIEHEGRVLARMLVVRMDPVAEEMLGVPPGAITAADLRDLRLSHVDAYVRRLIPYLLPRASQRRLRQPPPRRYERRDSDWHAQAAELYLQALNKAPRSPILWMMARYRDRGHDVSRATVRDWVRAARLHGFLTMGRKGSPGGAGTAKLREWQEQRATKGGRP